MTVKERLIEYISYKKISKSDFCRTIGVSTAFVSSMRISIQPDKIKNIALKYPDLNTGWLLTGEGEMLKSENGTVDKLPNNETVPMSVLQFIMEEQKKNGARVDDLIRQNGVLVETVRSQAEIIKKTVVTDVQLEEDAECAAASGSDLED